MREGKIGRKRKIDRERERDTHSGRKGDRRWLRGRER